MEGKKRTRLAGIQMKDGVQFLKFLHQNSSVPSGTLVFKIRNGTEQNTVAFLHFLGSHSHDNSQNWLEFPVPWKRSRSF